MNKVNAWIQASRIPSQIYILLPLLLGQGYAAMERGLPINRPIFLWIILYSLAIQLFIVFGNDYNDVEVDRLNRTFNLFSGGSRVLVEGSLRRQDLKKAICVLAGMNVLVAFMLTFVYGRYFALPLILLGMFLLILYSFSPFRINYRGGGEFLQIIGVAGLLPIIGYYAQSGVIEPSQLPWSLVLILMPFHLACAISTALPDYPSDKIGHKRTMVVILGPLKAKILIIMLNFMSIIMFVLIGWSGLNRLETFIIVSGPFIANLALICLIPGSDAGSMRLTIFVALNVVSVTVLLNSMMTIHVFVA